MNQFNNLSRLALAATIAAVMLAAPAAQADFSDDFDTAGDVSSNYSYFRLATFESGGGVDSFTSATANGSGFALDAANSEVDMVITDPVMGSSGAFDFIRVSRSGDASNQYDLTQPASLTVNASGLDALFFDAQRNPLVFGFDSPGAGNDVEVQIQKINFDPTTRISVNLPGGAEANYAVESNEVDIVLSIDDDSYSLLVGGTPVIPDTLHGLTFNAADLATPFFEARHTFAGGSTDFSVERFEGTGSVIPEPTSLALMMLGSLALVTRRRA